jgi:G:T/U-mismatch repair DNA glycosylase
MKIEQHPLSPFIPENAKILMLGSFPPSRSKWSMEFYYPNFQNDMWRIIGIVFKGNKNYFIMPEQKTFDLDNIICFLSQTGIALSDTAKSIIRQKDNASDKYLEVVETFELNQLLDRMPYCSTVVTTGQKATDTILSILNIPQPPIGKYSEFVYADRIIRLYRMPSSSRAYPKSVEEKAKVYEQMFREVGLL